MYNQELGDILNKSFEQDDISDEITIFIKHHHNNVDNEDIEDIASKINEFIYLDNHLQVNEVIGIGEISKRSIFDFDLHHKEDFIHYYHSLKKPVLAIKDKNQLLTNNEKYVFTDSFYPPNVQEYINYIRFAYHQNLKSMFSHIMYDIPAKQCDFFGYKGLILILVSNKNFFKI